MTQTRCTAPICTLVLLILLLGGCASPPTPPPLELPGPVPFRIAQHLREFPHPALSRELSRIYESRRFEPIWMEDGRLSDSGEALLRRLRTSAEDGLDPRDYHLEKIETLLQLAREAEPFEQLLAPGWSSHLDMLLTDAFLRFASHMTRGRLPAAQPTATPLPFERPDPVALLHRGIQPGKMDDVLRELEPPHPEYEATKKALGQLELIAVKGGWPYIPAAETSMRLWSRDPRVPALKERLRLSGDLRDRTDMDDPLIDRATGQAVRNFQKRHGLTADGVVGEKTLQALNERPEKKMERLRINLERMRMLPRTLGQRHVRVNIPDFRLDVFEQGECTLSMEAVVGRSDRPTPAFSAMLTFLEFSPYWYVPPTILAEDELPRIKADRRYLEHRDFEIVSWDKSQPLAAEAISWDSVTAETFPGMLRQRPGPRNPLGRVKFIFPNRHAVYIHDTPKRNLFQRDIRSLSSGCIRISRPEELATHLLMLEEGNWSAETISAAMSRSLPQRVDLQSPVPVHLTYFTAWSAPEGTLHFRPDIYDRDATFGKKLRQNSRELAARPFPGRRQQPPKLQSAGLD